MTTKNRTSTPTDEMAGNIIDPVTAPDDWVAEKKAEAAAMQTSKNLPDPAMPVPPVRVPKTKTKTGVTKAVARMADESAVVTETITRPVTLLAYKRSGGVLMIPMWTGKLIRDRNGFISPDICMCACADHTNGAEGVDFYIKRRNYRWVEDLPDDFAEFRDALVAARKALVQAERARLLKIKELEDLGVRKQGASKIPKSWATVMMKDA